MIDAEEFFEELKDPFGEWTEKDAKELASLLERYAFKKALQVVYFLLSKKSEQVFGLSILSNKEDAETFLRLQGAVQCQNDFVHNLLELANFVSEKTEDEDKE